MLQNIAKKMTRNIVDLVFCLDASRSMISCIEGVKENIEQLTGELKTTPNRKIDFRLGILAQDWKVFRILAFTDQLTIFRQALKKVEPKWEEFTLPAIDWSLDFAWRSGCHKVVIVFTDEVLQNNHAPDFQRSKLNELIDKIIRMRVMLLMIAPTCTEYVKLSKIPRSEFIEIEQKKFNEVNFTAVMKRIGQTVSASVGVNQPSNMEEKDIYKIKDTIKVEFLNREGKLWV